MPEEDKKSYKLPRQKVKDRKTVQRVLNRLELMKMTRKNHGDDMWDTWDRLYLSIPAREPEEAWMANVFVPFVNSTVLAILSEITSRRTRWKLLPVTAEDDDKVDTVSAVTEFTMEKGQWDDESFKRDTDKLIYGTSVWKEVYREDSRGIREKNPKTEKITTKDETLFNDVYGHHVPLRSFYLDDRARDIRTARDCIERTVMDIDDFKRKYKKYKGSSKVRSMKFHRATASDETIDNIPPGGDTTEEGAYIPTTEVKDNEVEVIEYWNKPRDEKIVVANGVLVVEEPNPYDHKQLPYAMDVCIPRPNSAYGTGVCELLYPLQEEMNTYRNMGLDQSKLAVHQPIIMDGMTVLDETEYKLRPGAIISTDGGSASPLGIPEPSQNYHTMMEQIRQDARVASGLDVRFAEGVNVAGNDTATEVVRLQEASLRRIGLITKVLEIRCLQRIGMLRTANIQQFYKDPLKVEQVVTDGDNITTDTVTGEPKLKKTYRTIRTHQEGKAAYSFKEIKPEDIRGNFDVYVVPQSTQPMSEAVLVKRLNVALNTVLQSEVALEVVDVAELFKIFFKHLNLPQSIVRDVLKLDEEVDYGLAEEENERMAGGESVPATPNPSMKHTTLHLAKVYQLDEQGRPTGIFTEEFQSLPTETRRIFQKHIEGELKQHAVKGNVPSDKARTQNRAQGSGTQTVRGGGEVEASGEGVF